MSVQKWFDPFWRNKLIKTYGFKKYSENWSQYVNRKNIKLPKGITHEILEKL